MNEMSTGSPWPVLIGGDLRLEKDSNIFVVQNPVDGSTVGTVSRATQSDTHHAIQIAEEAMPTWRGMTSFERYEILQRGIGLMRDRFARLCQVVVQETGKPIAEAEAEVANSIRFFDFFSHESLRLQGEYWQNVLKDRDAYVVHEPIGIVGAITPWNFPAFMVACKVGASLAAGCATLLKPAEETPITALEIAQCFLDAGLPGGVLSVLPTDQPEEVGHVFTNHDAVSCITFTGSTTVGAHLLAGAAPSIKRVLLELGGNAPVIVTEDADLEQASTQVVRARYSNAGQACVAANRVYVDQKIAQEFTDRVVKLAGGLRLGDPFDSNTNLGPLINRQSIDTLEGQVARAEALGAETILGGTIAEYTPTSGYFNPSVMVAEASNEVFKEEIFGPVLSITITKDDEEAIRHANDSDYGLSAYVFSGGQERGRSIASRINSGNVGVNCALVSDPALPFGGVRQSGLGRERGRVGVMEFTESKTIQVSKAF